MKQLLLLIVIVAIAAFAIYLFLGFFEAAETVKDTKTKSKKTSATRTESSGVYTGALKKAKQVKGTVESQQRSMLGEPDTKNNRAGVQKSRHQLKKEQEREEWYREVQQKQQNQQ